MTSPVPYPRGVDVRPGPALLAGVAGGPTLAAHRARHGAPPRLALPALVAAAEAADLRGRGGAGFPFARKLATAGRRGRLAGRPVPVVNLAEGEPGSAKDAALATTHPHLVLDGAAVAARALGAREVHVALPGERPDVVAAVHRAVAERDDERLRWRLHRAAPRFVAGQASAVLELLAGREGLPVTTWRPAAVEGLAGRPTVLSNAETWAHLGLLALHGVAAYRRQGTAAEPGTALLTLGAPDRTPVVVEVPHGAPLAGVLPAWQRGRPLLLGGFHGTWADPDTVASLPVSRSAYGSRGLTLGAGVVLAPAAGQCPLDLTVGIVRHLAEESSGRCGPCRNGLPALAASLAAVAAGAGPLAPVARVAGLVDGRGACAHPDGTARLVRSLLVALPAEVERHLAGGCGTREAAARPREVAS